jgi:hypothetical protein
VQIGWVIDGYLISQLIDRGGRIFQQAQHTHTQTHTYTHTHTHTHKHTNTHIRTTLRSVFLSVLSNTPWHHSFSHTHTHTHTHTQIQHAHTLTHAHSFLFLPPHAHSSLLLHTHTGAGEHQRDDQPYSFICQRMAPEVAAKVVKRMRFVQRIIALTNRLLQETGIGFMVILPLTVATE